VLDEPTTGLDPDNIRTMMKAEAAESATGRTGRRVIVQPE
jgi:energy-coupling factor transporter ATP-binding protein EcfA2